MFGGTNGITIFNDTWVWTSAGWELRLPDTRPYPMVWSKMVYDSWGQRNILVGYSIDRFHPGPQTWFWDGITWTRSIDNGVPASPGFSLAFDESTGQVILYGGIQNNGNLPPTVLDDTWIFDGGHWEWAGGSHPSGPESEPTPVQPPSFRSPLPRGYAAMTYDRSRQQIVLHGGYNYEAEQAFTDTWVWTGRENGWQQQFPANSPPASWTGYQMENDLLDQRVVAVGCPYPFCAMFASPAVWSWDGVDWSLTRPSDESGGPLVDDGFSLAEIPYYDGVLLFGGVKGAGWDAYINQTWAWGQLPQLFNRAPVAIIEPPGGGIPACTTPTSTLVTLDGSQSYDPDHQPLFYRWNGPFEGGTASGPTPHVGLPIGPSSITLTVSDGELTATASATVTVAVNVQGLESPLGPLVPLSSEAPLPTASFQAGRSLPLKLDLTCGTQKLTSSDVSPPRLVSLIRTDDHVAPAAATAPPTTTNDAAGYFRSENAHWIYNLSTGSTTYQRRAGRRARTNC